MSDYTAEQYAQLPEAFKGDFVEVKNGEDTMYRHGGFATVKQTANLKDAEAKDLAKQLAELRGQMTESEQKKADEIAQAKEDALAEALSKNDNAAATKLLQEKLADAERRAGESEVKFQERMQGIARDKEEVVINSLASLSAKGCDKALKRLLKDYIKVDADTGETTYLNDDGSASSLNETQFISSLNENELFKPLLKGNLPSNSRGLLNGSTGFGEVGGKEVNQAAEAAKKSGDSIGHLNAHFKEAFKR